MSPQGKELALVIINTGKGYTERCAAARDLSPGSRAARFVSHAWTGARAYEREFPGAVFSTADILAAAIELAGYYGAHVAESDALAKLDT